MAAHQELVILKGRIMWSVRKGTKIVWARTTLVCFQWTDSSILALFLTPLPKKGDCDMEMNDFK
jgi:hypothetical protein